MFPLFWKSKCFLFPFQKIFFMSQCKVLLLVYTVVLSWGGAACGFSCKTFQKQGDNSYTGTLQLMKKFNTSLISRKGGHFCERNSEAFCFWKLHSAARSRLSIPPHDLDCTDSIPTISCHNRSYNIDYILTLPGFEFEKQQP